MPDAVPQDRLLHISDLHFWEVVWNPLRLMNKRLLGNLNVYWRRRHEFLMHRAEEFADAAAATGIKTVVMTGDFTSTSTHGEFDMGRAFVQGLMRRGLQVILMPGNHDVYTFESVRERRFQHYFGEFLPAGGYPHRFTLAGGTPLIVVPTVTANFLSSKGRIRHREVREAARLIEECPPGPIVIAGHYPVLHRTYGYTTSPNRQLRHAEVLRAAMGVSGRNIFYLAGHVHRFSYVLDETYANLRHLTTPAFFLENRQDEVLGAFAEIHVAGEEFHVFQHRRKEVWERTPHPAQPGNL
ncbi:MAG: metallophosphoesterase [Candidatus Hydrogenedentes bacterium]|nr:metallophosphoesterase [Candidatus Hydrogenedentota bacterium]